MDVRNCAGIAMVHVVVDDIVIVEDALDNVIVICESLAICRQIMRTLDKATGGFVNVVPVRMRVRSDGMPPHFSPRTKSVDLDNTLDVAGVIQEGMSACHWPLRIAASLPDAW